MSSRILPRKCFLTLAILSADYATISAKAGSKDDETDNRLNMGDSLSVVFVTVSPEI